MRGCLACEAAVCAVVGVQMMYHVIIFIMIIIGKNVGHLIIC